MNCTMKWRNMHRETPFHGDTLHLVSVAANINYHGATLHNFFDSEITNCL